MKLPVKVNGVVREAGIAYIRNPAPDFSFLSQWEKSLGEDQNPVRVDAVNFANLACKRFDSHSPIEIYARGVEDIADHIKNNPLSEVAGLVTLRCNDFPDCEVIGLAHFRRSWSNNLILDYLAVHPWIGNPPEGHPTVVRGAGTALLYFLSSLGRQNQCGCIWGEATQNSCEFYQKVFGLDMVRDLLYIPREKFISFAENLEQKWKTQTV